MKKGDSVLVGTQAEKGAMWAAEKRLKIELVSRAEGTGFRIWVLGEGR